MSRYSRERRHRRMGRREREVPEPRLAGVPPVDRLRHLADRPVDGVAVLRQVPGPRQEVVVTHAAGVLHAGVAALGQEDLPVVGAAVELVAALLLQNHLVEPHPVALGGDVELAHAVGLVAALAEAAGQGRHVGQRVLLHEGPVAVGAGVHPRHQGAPRRDARGAGRVGLLEGDAVAAHLLHRGRHHHRVPGRPRQQPAPVVSADEQHVRSAPCVGHGSPSSGRGGVPCAAERQRPGGAAHKSPGPPAAGPTERPPRLVEATPNPDGHHEGFVRRLRTAPAATLSGLAARRGVEYPRPGRRAPRAPGPASRLSP